MMWPSEYAELNQIEDLLTCKICYEFIKTSVITPCSHNYCSLCIRKYLHYKTQCPACFEQIYEKDLRVNKVIDEIILSYSQVKEKLGNCLNKGKGEVGGNVVKVNDLNSPPITPQGAAQIPTVGSSDSEGKNKNYNASTPKSASPCVPKSPSNSFFSPSNSAGPKVASIFTPKSKKNQTEVICPICKVNIPETNVNRHLDDCLKRQRITEPVPKTQAKRKPLSKLVFRLMKDAAIRKKLKEYGLTSQGDRRTLEARLQRYITLYNSECDKSSPRPVSELIKQCEEEESIENKGNRTPATKKLQVNRNTAQNVIEAERKKYLEAHKHSFDQLIANVKKCQTPKKSTARRSIFSQDSANKSNDSPKRKALVESSSNINENSKMSDCRPLESSDVDSPESDSNIACPLQMYSSGTPVKVLDRSITADMSMSCGSKMTFDEENSNRTRSPILSSARKSPYSFHGRVQRLNINKSISSTSGDDLSPLSSKTSKMNAKVKLEFRQEREDENAILVDTSYNDANGKLYNITNEINSFQGKVPMYVDSRARSTSFTNPFIVQSSPKAGSILPDFPCDSSSSESVEQKYSYEVSKCEASFKIVDSEFVGEQLPGRTKLGKENKAVSEDSADGSGSFGKRGHDDVNDDENARKKRQTKGLTNFFSGNSNGDDVTKTVTERILHADENKKPSKKPRGRKLTASPRKGVSCRTRSARTKK